MLTHHRIKSELKNGEYRSVCDLIFEMDEPEESELPKYYEDQLLSVNKLLKYYILRKELSPDMVGVCFKRGKEVIAKMLDLFVTD